MKKHTKRKPFVFIRTTFKNIIIFFWWVYQIVKEKTEIFCEHRVLPWMAGVYLLMKEKLIPCGRKTWGIILSWLALCKLIFEWIIIHLLAFIWILSPFYWYLGNKGTVRLMKKIEKSTKDWKFDPLGAIAVALSIVMIGNILANNSPISSTDFVAYKNTNIVSYDEYPSVTLLNEEAEVLVQEPTQQATQKPSEVSDSGLRWFFAYDFAGVVYDETLLAKAERDYLILCVQHECGHDGSLFADYCSDYGQVQRALAKSFLNQRKNLGCEVLNETIGDTTIFGNLKSQIDEIYNILINGGDIEDLRNAGIPHPELYDLQDETTINNVNTVVYGLDDIPDNALFWRNDDGISEAEAWNTFLSFYDEGADLSLYLSVKIPSSEHGYYWMLFAQDNNFQ